MFLALSLDLKRSIAGVSKASSNPPKQISWIIAFNRCLILVFEKVGGKNGWNRSNGPSDEASEL